MTATTDHVGTQKRAPRYHWTTAEMDTLRRVYPTAGPTATAAALPHRDLRAIYQQARKHGLRAPTTRAPRQQWTWTDAELAALRRVYQSRPQKCDVVALALRLGKPRHAVSKRAVLEGLVTPRTKAPPWSREEDALLAEWAHCHPRHIARKFKTAGYARSETAITVRRKRVDVDTTDPDHYTAGALARLMGVDPKTVIRWIDKESLPAKRRGTHRTETQGDHYHIARKALREWVRTHAVLVDLRKVDRFWFLDLVFNA